MLINFISMAIVIWLTGVSVKDFACILVGQFDVIGSEKQNFFNDTMHFYLLRVSALAVIISFLLYYYLTKKVVIPLQKLVHSTKALKDGRYPQLLTIKSSDEVGELTKNFNELMTKLKHVDELRSKLVSDVSHELRTPLTNLNGYLEALSKGIIQGDMRTFESLHKESLRITTLVDQLHQLSELEYQNTSVMKEKVQIDDLIKGCIEIFAINPRNSHVRFTVDIEEGEVLLAPEGFKQVMTNLIQNAIQYHKGDGTINIRGFYEKNAYRIEVAGIGEPIPLKQKDLIFERFYRIEQSRNRASGGNGLGLAIVKEIVEAHHGKVGLTTDGSFHSFWFTVPLTAEEKSD